MESYARGYTVGASAGATRSEDARRRRLAARYLKLMLSMVTTPAEQAVNLALLAITATTTLSSSTEADCSAKDEYGICFRTNVMPCLATPSKDQVRFVQMVVNGVLYEVRQRERISTDGIVGPGTIAAVSELEQGLGAKGQLLRCIGARVAERPSQ